MMTDSTPRASPPCKSELEKKYRVWVVAPDREKSAISMALTLNHPLRINQVEENVFAVNGTTSDCVNIALQKILPQKPDFVVSGHEPRRKPFRRYFFFRNGGRRFFRAPLRHPVAGRLPDRRPGPISAAGIRIRRRGAQSPPGSWTNSWPTPTTTSSTT